jgi:predicted nicotinamide N-methyase
MAKLGCGLGVPSLVAARAGANVVATDASEEALELVELNARENGIHLETERVDWAAPDALVERSPFDLVLAADVLYERSSVALLLSLLPRLGNAVWIASPDRAMAEAFVTQAQREWRVETEVRGVVRIHRLRRHSSSTSR